MTDAVSTPRSPEPDLTALPRRERLRRALASLRRVVADPTRTEEVLMFSAYVNAGGADKRVARFFAEPTGRALYAERRAIDSSAVDLTALAALPPGTLGREYVEFLRTRGLSPDLFQAPDGVLDPRAAYVAQRFRQTHDLWHVVTGFDTNPASEVALQAFTFAQTGAPSTAILAAIGTLRAATLGYRMGRITMTAYRHGRDARYLGAFPWEDHWATPIALLRQMLGIEPVEMPPMPANLDLAA